MIQNLKLTLNLSEQFFCLFVCLLLKDFNLKITLPGLEEGSQSLKIRLLPGTLLTRYVG